jgi:hypothetical protein
MEIDGEGLIGRKRPRPEARAEVVALARLCGLAAEGALSGADAVQLMRGASALGVDARAVADRARGQTQPARAVCNALEDALGDEWQNAAAQARAPAANPLLAQLARQRLERRMFGTARPAPQEAATAPRGWQGIEEQEALERLPTELWDAIAARAAGVGGLFDPAALMAFSQMGRIGRDIAAQRRVLLYVVREPLEPPVLEWVPLIEYARLVRAFGETDPLRLFLAMTGCASRAYVARAFAALPFPVPADAVEGLARAMAPYPPYERAGIWYEAASASDPNDRRIRALGKAVPEPGQYLTAFLETSRAGGSAVDIFDQSLPIGPASEPSAGPDERWAGPTILVIPFDPFPMPGVQRLTAVGDTLSPEGVSRDIFDGTVEPRVVAAWIRGDGPATEIVREAAAAPDTYARVVATIDALVSDADPGPLCRRAFERSPYVPRFLDLYEFEPFLVPLPKQGAALLAVARLHSPPIEWALRALEGS